ncbi:MAG: hypothetical protein ACREJ3_15955 [Polyangiaceae bacterium]
MTPSTSSRWDSEVCRILLCASAVDIWLKALEAFLQRRPEGKLFDLMPSGEVVAWEIRSAKSGGTEA